jgi:hypothetical protein
MSFTVLRAGESRRAIPRPVVTAASRIPSTIVELAPVMAVLRIGDDLRTVTFSRLLPHIVTNVVETLSAESSLRPHFRTESSRVGQNIEIFGTQTIVRVILLSANLIVARS